VLCRQLGAHIDGWKALVAHTTVVGGSRDNVVTGRKADAILAAYYGVQAAARQVKLGVEARNCGACGYYDAPDH